MFDKMRLHNEAITYRQIADELKKNYERLDDETLRDTLEGISNLPEMLEAIIRSSLDDEIMMVGLKPRLEQMQERLARYKARYERKREIAGWVMQVSGLSKLESPDFSLYLRDGVLRLAIIEEGAIPANFLIPQPAKIDRAMLLEELRRGQEVPGASLAPGQPFIAVRLK
jgi:hypothetical protein